MAKLSTTELLDAFKELTLLELSDFVKQFEETFGVTAAAPVAVAAVAGGGAGAEAVAVEEQDEFDVILESVGDKKIQVIKEVRALTNLGLKEAKDLVDGAPKPVLEKATKEAAEKAKAALEGAGARRHGQVATCTTAHRAPRIRISRHAARTMPAHHAVHARTTQFTHVAPGQNDRPGATSCPGRTEQRDQADQDE